MKGWLKLWREMITKPIWTQSTPGQKSVLITLLATVNHTPNEWEWKGEKFVVGPGQTITSLASIAKASGRGVSIRHVRTALLRFSKLKFLTDEATKTGRLITIINWETYQGGTEDDDKGDDKGQTKGGHSGDKGRAPIKEGKKDNNGKKGRRESPDESSSPDVPIKPDPKPKPKPKPKEEILSKGQWESFWQIYPSSAARKAAIKAWNARIREGIAPDSLILYAKHYAIARAGKDGGYNMNGATFINGRYEEFVEPTQPEQLGRGSGRASGKKRPAKEMFGGGQEEGSDDG